MSKFSDETKKRVDDAVERMMSNLEHDSCFYDSHSHHVDAWKYIYASNLRLPTNVTLISTPPEPVYTGTFTLPQGFTVDDCEPLDLPKREGLNYITSYKELIEGDLILTVDYDYNESVERVKCVDMGVWTEGLVDGEELFETREEFAEYRFVILLNR